MKVPLVDLKEAIQRVPEFKVHIPLCVDTAHKQSEAIFGLTREETAAIKTYTASCEVHKLVNIALRSQQYKNIEPWFAFLKLFHTAINKLNAQKGSFCRGENEDWSDSYTVGSIVTWVSETVFLHFLAYHPKSSL
jgi:hypothetical protein